MKGSDSLFFCIHRGSAFFLLAYCRKTKKKCRLASENNTKPHLIAKKFEIIPKKVVVSIDK